MPGSSRLPVSLRDTFNARKNSANGQLVAFNIDVYALRYGPGRMIALDMLTQ